MTDSKDIALTEIDGHEVLGVGIYPEYLPIGRNFSAIDRILPEADLVNFTGVTGMARSIIFQYRVSSPRKRHQTACCPRRDGLLFPEGLLVHATMRHIGFAFLNTELNVKAPTFTEDTIHVECEVVESRSSTGRPNRGLVRTFKRVVNQDGTVVLTYKHLRMVKAKGPRV